MHMLQNLENNQVLCTKIYSDDLNFICMEIILPIYCNKLALFLISIQIYRSTTTSEFRLEMD